MSYGPTYVCKHCYAEIIPWTDHSGATYVLYPGPDAEPDINQRWCPDGPNGEINRHSPIS